MTPTPIVVVGAGGFGRETLDVIEAVNAQSVQPAFTVLGVLDDRPSADNLHRLAQRRIRHLGTVDSWLARSPQAQYLLGIGDPMTRQRIAPAFERSGLVAPVLVHPRSSIGSNTVLGPGTVVCAGAALSTNIRTGRHVHINPNATVGHDTTIGDFVSVNPAATLSGDCSIHNAVLIGAGAVVLQGLQVGAESVVGAAACVVTSVPNGVVVKGVPAR